VFNFLLCSSSISLTDCWVLWISMTLSCGILLCLSQVILSMNHIWTQHTVKVFLIDSNLCIYHSCIITLKSSFEFWSLQLFTTHNTAVITGNSTWTSWICYSFTFLCGILAIIDHQMSQIIKTSVVYWTLGSIFSFSICRRWSHEIIIS
jgi:hypothetical protein